MEVSLQDMFQALMVEDGRGDEYEELHKKFMEEDGRWGAESRTRWAVMKAMGYEEGTANKWRKRYFETFGFDEDEIGAEQAREAVSELEKTLASIALPPVASPALELEWVRGHPAMMRKDLKGENDRTPVRLTPEDILQAPHGPPPSRSAVNQLVNWANRPDKFNEQLLGVNRKAEYIGTDAAAKEEAEDMSLHEVRELLKQLASGKRHNWR